SPAASRKARRCRSSRCGVVWTAPPVGTRPEERRTESPRFSNRCSSTANGVLSVCALTAAGACAGETRTIGLVSAAWYARSRAAGPPDPGGGPGAGYEVSAGDGRSDGSRPPLSGTRPTTAESDCAADIRTGSSRNVGRLGVDGASSTPGCGDGCCCASRVGCTTTTAVSTVIPMITALTMSAFRFSRLASGSSGRSGGGAVMECDSLGKRRVRYPVPIRGRVLAFHEHAPLLPVDPGDEDGPVEQPIRHIRVAADDAVVDEDPAAVGLEDQEHWCLGVLGLRGQLDVDARSIVEHLGGRPRELPILLHPI